MSEEKEKGLVVSKEIALQEVNKWLDHREVDEEERADDQKTVRFLAKEVANGRLIINADWTLTQKLRVPLEIDGLPNVAELKYADRICMDKVHKRLENIRSNSGSAKIAAHVAALTNQATAVIQKMDSKDYSTAVTINLIFFS